MPIGLEGQVQFVMYLGSGIDLINKTVSVSATFIAYYAAMEDQHMFGGLPLPVQRTLIDLSSTSHRPLIPSSNLLPLPLTPTNPRKKSHSNHRHQTSKPNIPPITPSPLPHPTPPLHSQRIPKRRQNPEIHAQRRSLNDSPHLRVVTRPQQHPVDDGEEVE